MKTRPDLFTFTVNSLAYGATAVRLSEHLSECVEAARETGKPAKLVITLTIKPIGRDTGQYEIQESIKPALPELDRGATLMFGTPDGNLQREDPRQQKLNLKQVPDDTPAAYISAEE